LSQPALVPILTRPTKSVIVRHDLSNAKTFLLERVVKTEALSPEPTTSKEKRVDQYTHPYQQQQFLLQKQQQELEKQHQLLNGIFTLFIKNFGPVIGPSCCLVLNLLSVHLRPL